MSELKPCPFCGGEPIMFCDESTDTWNVLCDNVQCPAEPGTAICFSEQEAINAWNTRAERTCRMEWDEDGEGDELYPVGHVTCSACGAWLYAVNTMRFCPKCGAKVVE